MGIRIPSTYLRSLEVLNSGLAKARLRTKFLVSLTLLIAALTFATLAVVHHAAEEQVRAAVEQDARNSVLTFQTLRAERQIQLERTAELLATLPELKAVMADQQLSGMQDASEQMWRSGDTELFALADWTGKIVALHTLASGFPREAAEKALAHSAGSNGAGGWWFGEGHLYQVAVRPIQLGGSSSQMYLGTVIVGREIDSRVAADVGRIALCQVAFRYGDEAVVSSFSTMDDGIAANGLKSDSSRDKLQIGDKSYLVSSVNLTPGSSPPLTLTVLKPYDDAMAFLTRLNHTLLTLGFLAVFAGAGLVFVLSRTFTRPLDSLVQGVRALEDGNYDYPLDPDGGDEVSEVTAAFERMRGTLLKNQEQRTSLENQLRQAQKMEAVGRLAGGVAHDFNNLLTVIKGHTELLLNVLPPADQVTRKIEQIDRSADRAASLTRQLLAFSRMQVLQPQVMNLNKVTAEMGKLLPRLIGEDIELIIRLEGNLGSVKADASQMEQVIMNLAVNARDAMPNGGKLVVETANVDLDKDYTATHPLMVPGSYVQLVVTDSGTGMDPETQTHIFEPFFTTKENGKGTGLGLSTVYGVVKQSGGFIWVYSELG